MNEGMQNALNVWILKPKSITVLKIYINTINEKKETK